MKAQNDGQTTPRNLAGNLVANWLDNACAVSGLTLPGSLRRAYENGAMNCVISDALNKMTFAEAVKFFPTIVSGEREFREPFAARENSWRKRLAGVVSN